MTHSSGKKIFQIETPLEERVFGNTTIYPKANYCNHDFKLVHSFGPAFRKCTKCKKKKFNYKR